MATESVLASRDTLVKYSNPVIVSKHPEKPLTPVQVILNSRFRVASVQLILFSQ